MTSSTSENGGHQTPENEPPSAFALLGENEAQRLQSVRTMVEGFYSIMDRDPRYARIRALHPRDLSGSIDKLYLFLSGWLGGPSLYIEKYGHPRLRARHLPFPISSEDRDQWLMCMLDSLRAMCLGEDFIRRLMQSFFQTADWMRNTPDAPLTEGSKGAQA